jgi:hypothetical protein
MNISRRSHQIFATALAALLWATSATPVFAQEFTLPGATTPSLGNFTAPPASASGVSASDSSAIDAIKSEGSALGIAATAASVSNVPILSSVTNLFNLGVSVGGVPTADQYQRIKNNIDNAKFTADNVFFTIINQVIAQMTRSTVAWINNGFQGKPSFITDPASFFRNVGDQVAGAYITNLGLSGVLCSPFRPKILLSLTQYAQQGTPTYSCTLSAVVKNFNGFLTNFNNGGWAAWVSLSRQENNPYAQIVAQTNALDQQKAAAQNLRLQEAQWGRGFISTRNPNDPNQIVTPGSVIESQLNDALDASARRIQVASSFNQVVSALFNLLATKVISGPGGLLGANQSTPTQPSAFDQAAQAQLQSQIDARNSILAQTNQNLALEQQYKAYKDTTITMLVATRNSLVDLVGCSLGVATSSTTVSGQKFTVIAAGSGGSTGGTTFGTINGSGTNAVTASNASTTIAADIDPYLGPALSESAEAAQYISAIQTANQTSQTATDLGSLQNLLNAYANIQANFHSGSDLSEAQSEQSTTAARLGPIFQDTQTKLVQCRQGTLTQ